MAGNNTPGWTTATSITTNQAMPSMVYETEEMTDDEMKEFFYLDPVESLHVRPQEEPTTTEIVLEDDDDDDYSSHGLLDVLEIPDYLALTENNTFEQMVQQKIYPLSSSINIEQLGEIALLMHQLNVLDLEKSLWTTYFQSGTGILKLNASNLKVWPSKMKRMILSEQRTRAAIRDFHEIKVHDDDCLKFVHIHQNELDKKRQHLQQQLKLKKQHVAGGGFTILMENILQTFIQEHIQNLRLKYEYKMKLVEFNYQEQVLEHTFLQQNPTEQQKQLIKGLFSRNYDCEKAKEEVRWMKKQIEQKQLPKSIDSIQISLPFSIQSLTDTDLRQRLSDRQYKIIQQYKNEMKSIFMDIVEAKERESQKIFDDELAKLWSDQPRLPMAERLNPIMIDFIGRRRALITEKVRYIYHYKHTH